MMIATQRPEGFSGPVIAAYSGHEAVDDWRDADRLLVEVTLPCGATAAVWLDPDECEIEHLAIN